jgi:hypothetical protein
MQALLLPKLLCRIFLIFDIYLNEVLIGQSRQLVDL